MPRILPFVLAALALPAAGAAPAGAAELTYVDQDNVVVENLDGSARHALSADGTAARPYALPTADRFGNLAAFQLSPDGAQQEVVYWEGGAGTPVRHRMPRSPGDFTTSPPTSARMQPDALEGAQHVTLGYTFHAFGDPSQPRYGRVEPSFPALSGAQSSATWSDLTWHRERPVVADGGDIYWTGRTQPLIDGGAIGWDLSFAEISADGSKILLRFRVQGSDQSQLGLFAYAGQIGFGDITDGCLIPTGPGFGRAALSRDGQSVAWDDAGGVHLAQADPTRYEGPNGAETCVLAGARTVSPTARMPSFADASTTMPPPPPAPPGGGGGGTPPVGGTTTPGGSSTTTKPGGGSTTTTPGSGGTATTFRLTLPKGVRAAALRRGLAVKATAPGAGKVTLTLRRGRKAIASGSATARTGGTVTVKLKARKGAGRLTGTAKLSATFTPEGGGAKRTRTASLKVR